MLRPDRRTRRAFAGILVTITALALIWPASFALGRTISSTTVSGPGSAGAPHSNRQPTVHGLGRQPFKANAGEKRSKPLQHLATNSANRGTSDKTRGLRAPAITATPPASVQATLSGAPAATSFGAFEGINQATSTFEPPDPWVAVGPDDVVQSTNTMLRFSSREGHSTAGDVQLFDFFAFDQLVPGQPDFIDGIGDPHWLYDAKHNRWLGTTLAWHCDTDGAGTNDDSLGFVWGAISLTGDPTGDYYQFYVLYNSFLPDFPAVGTSADKFAITANEFILSDQPDCTAGIPFDGGSVTAFDWTQMLTSPAVPDITYQFDTSWFALRPAVQPQSQTNTLFVVGEKLLPSPAGDTTSNVVYMTVTGTNAGGGTTLSAEKDLTAGGVVPGFVDPPVPIQPGGALDPNILDRRPSDAIWQNNVLTVVSTTGCDPAGGAVETRDCARVTQVNTTTSTPTRVQDMLIATPAKDTWYPGAGISQSGILHVVYTQSSSAPAQGMSSYRSVPAPLGCEAHAERARHPGVGRYARLYGRPLGRLRRRGPGPARHQRRLAGQPVHGVAGRLEHEGQRAPDRGRDVQTDHPGPAARLAGEPRDDRAVHLEHPQDHPDRRPARHPEQRGRDHRQPHRHRPAAGGLRVADACPRREPGDVHDQLPAGRQPGEQHHEPAQLGGRGQHHVQGRRREADPLPARHHRLLPQ